MKLNPFCIPSRWSCALAGAALLAFSVSDLLAADPVVSNVRAAQREGTRLVDIEFDVADPDSPTLQIAVEVSDNAGASYTVPAVSFTGDVGHGIRPGPGKRITWDAKKDWPNQYSSKVRFRVLASDVWLPPRSMALIPVGVFTMGDARVVGPVHPVDVSAFAIDRTEVTTALWREVQSWGLEHRYDLTSGGSWGSDHPIHTVNWFDVVKWCNARSEKEGLVPAYYLDEAKTQVYRSGDKVPTVNWNAGYRLPTEAEWEKAARGGVEGKLYPWADSEEISDDRLNYNNKFGRTTPVGSYPANGYGLRDMAGNVWEWVWDWHAEYPGGLVTDPRGPESGSARLLRGGGWVGAAEDCRAADRLPHPPTRRNYHIGFRAVLPVGQP
jgi:formylglycine-generating enzyme required for sulfatase activity